MTPFRDFLLHRLEAGGFTTEDALAAFLPLVRQVEAAHQAGRVAPLEGVGDLQVDGVAIRFDEARRRPPSLQVARLRELEKDSARAVEVVRESRVAFDVADGGGKSQNLDIGERGQAVTRPVYLPGYVSWETEIGHHDPLTDTFVLGLILASLTCGLDLHNPEHLARFVHHRGNLFDLNPQLHPVLAKAVARMTELDRHRRPQDLAALAYTLENHRDQDIDFEFELARGGGFRGKDLRGRRRLVLHALQQRLFEISRRNRLLHFRQTLQTVNLTVASVPLAFDAASIRPEQLLTCTPEFQQRVAAGKALSLNKYLRFEEAIYLPGLLDRIRSEAQRDLVEFGFAQLRLVLCFLRWSNLKEKPPERFDSPLVLLPVRLTKKKGVRDTYHLEPLSAEAEVNPVLRHYLKQLYDVALPEAVDLASTSVDRFHEFLAAKVQASEPGVSVVKVDRPRIHLIHATARRRLDQYVQRTRLSGRGVHIFADLDYSYDRENFHPLGLRLFQTRIRRPETNLETVIRQAPRPRTFMVPAPPAETPAAEEERRMYALPEAEDANPFHWEFDLCRVTLGNFRYRKMSLVRDYAALLENGADNPGFDALFSAEPRPLEPAAAPLPLEERFPVVACDPTQASAIGRARAGTCYIIQGPPGTGKSQTITNLIADYVAQGKRVLFVCQKRAAIDVVYHRLRETGLHLLCALIHDSQEDKKAFIMDLKQTYEAFLEGAGREDSAAESRRRELLQAVGRELKPLEQFHDAMCSERPEAKVPLRSLLRRLVELCDRVPELPPAAKERLPVYAEWVENRERVERLTAHLKDTAADGILARHPLKNLSPRLAAQERPLGTVARHLEEAGKVLDELEREFDASGLSAEQYDTPEKMAGIVRFADQVGFLAERDLLSLLDPTSDASKRLAADLRQWRKKAKRLEEARSANKAWRKKLPASEASSALAQAQGFEQSFFSFLKPSYWQLRGTLRRSYNFRAHRVKPTWTQILEALAREYQAAEALDGFQAKVQETLRIGTSLGAFSQEVTALRESAGPVPPALQAVQSHLLKMAQGNAVALRLAGLKPLVEQLLAELNAFLDGAPGQKLSELRGEFGRIEESLDGLADFVPCLAEAARLPAELLAVLRELPLPDADLEAALAHKTWEGVTRADRALGRFTGPVRARHIRQLAKDHGQFYAANAVVVCERVRRKFLEHVRLAGLPHAQLTAEQKEFKAAYNRGRRELEHEFGKTMRYRSIRDLATGDPGRVIQDIKPVWLMGPLSVSDTLPLDAAPFDVVIFDEASQVPLEEAVPSLFRAAQAIVVGDPMQLPPTSFFSVKHADDEERLLAEDDANGEVVEYDLEGNSFLTQAARVLPSTMLGWHYRSRSEALISFSNAAFYQAQLLTVPDRMLPTPDWGEIRVARADQGAASVPLLLGRPLSFHRLENGVYHNRVNPAEAEYIAHLVRELLRRETGQSIGIIAFSEAQQGEIFQALNRLGEEDPAFGERLEAEFEREEQGQFVGLLVKNLENIQGDERDVVILSVCYGPDRRGKTLMHFGPINQSGGEKRLNVAFSRAKRHMALVTSMTSSAITNDYNDGARCLKSYLRYAEAASRGDLANAGRVLREMSGPSEGERKDRATADPVAEQLAAALAARGYQVDRDLGQSSFRCDLAIRRPGDAAYRACVLVDTDAYYRQTDLLERDVMRPALLESFGWRVAHVLAKDWYQNRQIVLQELERVLEGAAGAP